MTMSFAAYRTAIKTWVEAQSGLTAQWRDDTGGWQQKPRVRMHLRDSGSRGVDYVDWAYDGTLDAPDDFVPTVHGLRSVVLSLIVETRDQSGDTTAAYYLEKLRTSMKKPSVRAGLYASGVVIESAEAVVDMDGWFENRVESRAHLDVHLGLVDNERDENEAQSYVDNFTATGALTTPAGDDAGPGEEDLP